MCSEAKLRLHELQPARLLCPWDLPARPLQQVATSFSRASSRPRDRTGVSCIGRQTLAHCPTWEALSAAHSQCQMGATLVHNEKHPGELARGRQGRPHLRELQESPPKPPGARSRPPESLCTRGSHGIQQPRDRGRWLLPALRLLHTHTHTRTRARQGNIMPSTQHPSRKPFIRQEISGEK